MPMKRASVVLDVVVVVVVMALLMATQPSHGQSLPTTVPPPALIAATISPTATRLTLTFDGLTEGAAVSNNVRPIWTGVTSISSTSSSSTSRREMAEAATFTYNGSTPTIPLSHWWSCARLKLEFSLYFFNAKTQLWDSLGGMDACGGRWAAALKDDGATVYRSADTATSYLSYLVISLGGDARIHSTTYASNNGGGNALISISVNNTITAVRANNIHTNTTFPLLGSQPISSNIVAIKEGADPSGLVRQPYEYGSGVRLPSKYPPTNYDTYVPAGVAILIAMGVIAGCFMLAFILWAVGYYCITGSCPRVGKMLCRCCRVFGDCGDKLYPPGSESSDEEEENRLRTQEEDRHTRYTRGNSSMDRYNSKRQRHDPVVGAITDGISRWRGAGPATSGKIRENTKISDVVGTPPPKPRSVATTQSPPTTQEEQQQPDEVVEGGSKEADVSYEPSHIPEGGEAKTSTAVVIVPPVTRPLPLIPKIDVLDGARGSYHSDNHHSNKMHSQRSHTARLRQLDMDEPVAMSGRNQLQHKPPPGQLYPPPPGADPNVTTSVPPAIPPPWFYHAIGVDHLTEREVVLTRQAMEKEDRVREERQVRREKRREERSAVSRRMQAPIDDGDVDDNVVNNNINTKKSPEALQESSSSEDEIVFNVTPSSPVRKGKRVVVDTAAITIPSLARYYTSTCEVPLGAPQSLNRRPTVGLVTVGRGTTTTAGNTTTSSTLRGGRAAEANASRPLVAEDEDDDSNFEGVEKQPSPKQQVEESSGGHGKMVDAKWGTQLIESSSFRLPEEHPASTTNRFATLLPQHNNNINGSGGLETKSGRRDARAQQRSQREYITNVSRVQRNLVMELHQDAPPTSPQQQQRQRSRGASGRDYGDGGRFIVSPPTPRGHAQSSIAQHHLQVAQTDKQRRLNELFANGGNANYTLEQHNARVSYGVHNQRQSTPPPSVAAYVYRDSTTPRIFSARDLPLTTVTTNTPSSTNSSRHHLTEREYLFDSASFYGTQVDLVRRRT